MQNHLLKFALLSLFVCCTLCHNPLPEHYYEDMKQRVKFDTISFQDYLKVSERVGAYFDKEHPTLDEIRQQAAESKIPINPEIKSAFLDQFYENYLPINFDWREAHPVCMNEIPPKDQGQCNAGYAFSVSYVLGRGYCLKSKGAVNEDLSPQDLISCDYSHRECLGGSPLGVYNFVELIGVCQDSCKSYSSIKRFVPRCDLRCDNFRQEYAKYRSKKNSIKLFEGGKNIERALLSYGPMTVGMDLHEDLLIYKGGIYRHDGKSRFLGTHIVTLIGYGSDSKSMANYWILRNSWGENWGEGGYFRIAFDEANVAKFAIISDPEY